jgi:LacI family transcriptional regulator
MPTTIKQIAEELGINPSTVSRALSGHPYISEKTRKKVLQKANQLDYLPNIWAQNLVNSTTNLIGCLVLELTNPFYIPMVRAIEDIANQQDYIIFIGESRRNLEMEKHAIERLRQIQASGVVITPVLSDLDHLKSLKKNGVPVIIAGRTVKELDSINIDNVKSGMVAGRHFFDLGYKNIGYIQSGDQFNIPERERYKGLKKVLKDYGINLSTVYTVGNNRIAGGEKAGELWLMDKKHPEAVFCSNDLLAMGFVQSLVRLGIQIPGEVAVLGHDDIPFADTFVIPLSTIAFPKYEMGKLAINLLLERINKNENSYEPRSIALEPELMIRSSCN